MAFEPRLAIGVPGLEILVVGDSYMPASVFGEALAGLEADHHLTYLQLDETSVSRPVTASEHLITEYAGTPAQIRTRVGSAEVLVVHCAPVTSEVLAAAPRLRLVCCARGGPVNVDIGALAARQLPLVTTPGKNAQAVAELTLGFLVALARGVVEARDAARRNGGPAESVLGGAAFIGRELSGSTLGVIGLGNVGRRVAAAALALGMSVHGYDPYVGSGDLRGVRVASDLDDVLRIADFLSLHARATPENTEMIDRRALGTMKRGAFLINTARETLIDEEALADAVRSGHLAGAALDVIRKPTLGGANALVSLDNVLLTPHIGGATYETLRRGAQMIAADVGRFAIGAPLQNVLPLQAAGR